MSLSFRFIVGFAHEHVNDHEADPKGQDGQDHHFDNANSNKSRHHFPPRRRNKCTDNTAAARSSRIKAKWRDSISCPERSAHSPQRPEAQADRSDSSRLSGLAASKNLFSSTRNS